MSGGLVRGDPSFNGKGRGKIGCLIKRCQRRPESGLVCGSAASCRGARNWPGRSPSWRVLPPGPHRYRGPLNA
ncbi:hypothetical protein [Thermanaeromonas toyohensis]|uniref:hypothetical protein n=1 Tax=Thermanaeromonas toyohensis TaxID=161154 RepID=UPI001E51AEFA|nr:hypothetical protein [Thermanaeromonas toyohensis]